MNGTGSGRVKVDRDLSFNPLYDAVQIALLALRIPQQFTGKSRQWHAAYRSLFRPLQRRQSIWRFSGTVSPPFDHGTI